MGVYLEGQDNREVADRNFAPRFAKHAQRLANCKLQDRVKTRRLPKTLRRRAEWYDYSTSADGPTSVRWTLEVAREYHLRIMKRSTSCRVRHGTLVLHSRSSVLRSRILTAIRFRPFADEDKKDEDLALWAQKARFAQNRFYLRRMGIFRSNLVYPTQNISIIILVSPLIKYFNKVFDMSRKICKRYKMSFYINIYKYIYNITYFSLTSTHAKLKYIMRV